MLNLNTVPKALCICLYIQYIFNIYIDEGKGVLESRNSVQKIALKQLCI